MFIDPQSVNATGAAANHVRIPSPQNEGAFVGPTGLTKLVIKQNTNKSRFRHEARISLEKVAPDPITALNKAVSASVYLVIDEPSFGFTDAELKLLVTGLTTWLTAPNQDKLLLGEV